MERTKAELEKSEDGDTAAKKILNLQVEKQVRKPVLRILGPFHFGLPDPDPYGSGKQIISQNHEQFTHKKSIKFTKISHK